MQGTKTCIIQAFIGCRAVYTPRSGLTLVCNTNFRCAANVRYIKTYYLLFLLSFEVYIHNHMCCHHSPVDKAKGPAKTFQPPIFKNGSTILP